MQVSAVLCMGFTAACGGSPADVPRSQPRGSFVIQSAIDPELPAGYVSTPGGYAHSSCVHVVPEGTSVATNQDGKTVASLGGEIIATYHCDYPLIAFQVQPDETPAKETTHTVPPSPTSFQWKAWAYNQLSSGWATEMHATIAVPAAPTGTFTSPQVVYVWPGLETTGFTELVQPVLQFGYSPAGGGNYWAMANWYLNDSPTVVSTPAVMVNVGNSIETSMISSSCDFFASCNWQLNWTVHSSGISHTFNAFAQHALQLALTGVLEGYALTNCNQYPNTTFSEINSITLKTGSVSNPNARNSYTLTAGTAGVNTADPLLCGWSSHYFPVALPPYDQVQFH